MSSKAKNHQKLLFNRDTLNSTGDLSLPGLFKSTSSLARSITKNSLHSKNQQVQQSANYNSDSLTNRSSSLKSSALLILNSRNDNSYNNIDLSFSLKQKNHNISASGYEDSKSKSQQVVSYLNPVTEIRNLTHFYDKLDSNQNTYELLSTLKADKRRRQLDAIDLFDTWDKKYLTLVDEKTVKQLNELKDNLNKTKSEINSLLSKSDIEIESLTLKHIKKIESKFKKFRHKRNKEVNDVQSRLAFTNNLNLQEIKEKVSFLVKDLNLIGFQLVHEIEEIANSKNAENTNYFESKNNFIRNEFTDIQDEETIFIKESEINLFKFIRRWKNTKLNTFVKNLKDTLLSSEYVDNQERYKIISEIKQDQENIYQSRVKIFTEKILNKCAETFTNKHIEQATKQLEDIYNSAQNIYDTHTKKLVGNSDKILNLSLVEIEKFKDIVKTIEYQFGEGKDNYNENLYNNYEELKSVEDLIAFEINPIIEIQKQTRKDYIQKIISYLDQYDEYTHNVSLKLLNIFGQIAFKNDEHKRVLYNSEKNYLVELAKAADHDEDVINEKEESLKKIIQLMKESIDKEELDKNLEEAFKILDELGIEYKEFFKIVESLLTSHDELIRNVYNIYEENLMSIFGYVNKEKLPIILAKRDIESEFLSKVKEAEIAAEEAKAALEAEKKDPKSKGAAAKKKQNPTGGKNKKGEIQRLVPPRGINEFTSKMNNKYLADFSITELIQNYLRNVIYNRDDNILNYIPRIEEETIDINPNHKADAKGKAVDQKKEKNSNSKNQQVRSENKEKTVKANESPAIQLSKKVTDIKDSAIPNLTTNPIINILEQFNPYAADSKKVFESPLSIKNTKLLSEDNLFREDYLIEILEKVFDTMTSKIADDLKKFIDKNVILDNEKRENFLTELDLKLKSLAPRKGKIEVEEYDKRLTEIDKHKEKFEAHLKMILERNQKDTESNKALIEEISDSFKIFNQLYEKLFKGMEEETTLKGLEEKQKRFKVSFYELNTFLEEAEEKYLDFSKTNPENLVQLNKNFIMSMHTFSRGGTYSDREEEFYKSQIEKINEEQILREKQEREILHDTKLKEIRANMNSLLEKIEKKYSISYENVLARDAVGEKFGAPRRLANDIIIKIKIKCNQAQDGLNNLLEKMRKLIADESEMDKGPSNQSK